MANNDLDDSRKDLDRLISRLDPVVGRLERFDHTLESWKKPLSERARSTKTGTPESPTLREAWILEEQKQRRQEIENKIARLEQDRTLTIGAVAAYWAWLVTSLPKDFLLIPGVAWIVTTVPTVIVLVMWARFIGWDNSIRFIADYTKVIEDSIQLPPGIGWERHIQKTAEKDKWKTAMRIFDHAIWVVLLAGNGLLGWLILTKVVPALHGAPQDLV
jgi:hypothetical protein